MNHSKWRKGSEGMPGWQNLPGPFSEWQASGTMT